MEKSFIKAVVFYLVVSAAVIFGCEQVKKEMKHQKSDFIGLKRVVILYDCNGSKIKEWSGRFKVETINGIASFINDDGNEVKISGIYTIEEVK